MNKINYKTFPENEIFDSSKFSKATAKDTMRAYVRLNYNKKNISVLEAIKSTLSISFHTKDQWASLKEMNQEGLIAFTDEKEEFFTASESLKKELLSNYSFKSRFTDVLSTML